MEHQEILNLLDGASNSRFVTRKSSTHCQRSVKRKL